MNRDSDADQGRRQYCRRAIKPEEPHAGGLQGRQRQAVDIAPAAEAIGIWAHPERLSAAECCRVLGNKMRENKGLSANPLKSISH